MDLEIVSHSAQETRSLGFRLGQRLQPGDLLCLQGDLGAGKTTFTQGVAQGWGSVDAVSSPTFVMVNQYRASDGRPLYHMDAYRLQNLAEAAELGLDEMLADGALVMEWPERALALLPPERLWLTLTHIDESTRLLRFSATGERFFSLLVF